MFPFADYIYIGSISNLDHLKKINHIFSKLAVAHSYKLFP
jgi:hypothetical protein